MRRLTAARFALVLDALLCALMSAFLYTSAAAGTLRKADVQAMFPPPLLVGDKLATLPVWPVFRRSDGGLVLKNHVFETIDLEPAPGYAGKPINLVVVMDRDGSFVSARLLTHNEPIFRSPEGTAKLDEFAAQYPGITVQHPVQVLSPKAQREVTPGMATLHGILAGTVTALTIDRSIMESAAQVAQMNLAAQTSATSATSDTSSSTTAAPRAAPTGLDDRYQRNGFNGLAAAGLIQRWAIDHREVERLFRDGPGAGRDAQALIRPQSTAIDLWTSVVSLPQAGRNLLQAPRWREVRALREQGVMVLMVLDGGRYSLTSPDTSASTTPGQRGLELGLRQGPHSFALRELPWRAGLRMSGQHSGVAADSTPRYFTVQPAADGSGVDLYQPMQLALTVWRRSGDEAAELARAGIERRAAIPNAETYRPAPETPRWIEAFAQRRVELAVLGVALLALSVALVMQRRLAATPARLRRFRIAFLAFTLVYVGWIAQAQLTIVSVTSGIEALVAGSALDFLLADPMAVLLWGFTLVTLIVWGRGTFCGWLCPFGALQELLALLVRALGLAQKRFRVRTDVLLKRIKYVVLALLVGTATLSAAWTEQLVEVEPFKTSISLYFQRDWPYLLWAALCLGVGLVVFRGYCRYVCPLGAAFALLGRLRLWGWIPRRAECGTPCQTCRHRCEYEAIAPSGAVDYSECFQCLDCVQTHDDDHACLPLVLKRTGKAIPVRMVMSTAKGRA